LIHQHAGFVMQARRLHHNLGKPETRAVQTVQKVRQVFPA
jgi:hypothetical protein